MDGDPLIDALGLGADLRTVRDRLEDFEGHRQAFEDEASRVAEKRSLVRQQVVSTEVFVEGFDQSPTSSIGWWGPRSGRRSRTCSDRYVDVIYWLQDQEDPATGTVEVTLFEQSNAVVTVVDT